MKNGSKETVLVAMSGGVDSSVAAALLVDAGHRVIGATMKTFCYSENAGPSRTCCGLDGILDARRVCDRLGIPHYVFDMEEAFSRDVIDDFVAEYAAGRTPNPCVRCNSNTKIPDLLRRGRRLGADAIATGHYARTAGRSGDIVLLRGVDRAKDQSYFLWDVPRDVLRYMRFPVGQLTKSEVRAKARQLDLSTADKPESQEICFVPTGSYADFLGKQLGQDHAALSPGSVVTMTGERVGEHRGYARYTVGQRRGLGGGRREPLYVLGVRPNTKEVVVGTDDELFRRHVWLEGLNWLGTTPSVGDELLIQIRHRAEPVAATIQEITDAALQLELTQPQRAVTPGQSGAIYRGETLIGGGRIR